MKLGLIQLQVVNDKAANLTKAEEMIEQAVLKGAQVVMLPEMFNCPYENTAFLFYSEKEGEETYQYLSRLAKKHQIVLVGGSIPEREGKNLYNTSYIFDQKGACIGKHRKVHLFDIDVKGKIKFVESDVLSAGEMATIVETTYGKIGVCICYDIRFPEFARKMVLEGAKLILVPAAFNMTTGPAHWQLTAQARALDNQVYYGLCSPARDETSSYVAYGHSLITSPWGDVLSALDETEGILIQDIDLDYEMKIREELPLLKHRKPECY